MAVIRPQAVGELATRPSLSPRSGQTARTFGTTRAVFGITTCSQSGSNPKISTSKTQVSSEISTGMIANLSGIVPSGSQYGSRMSAMTRQND